MSEYNKYVPKWFTCKLFGDICKKVITQVTEEVVLKNFA